MKLQNAISAVESEINFIAVYKQLQISSWVAILQVESSPASSAVYLGPGR